MNLRNSVIISKKTALTNPLLLIGLPGIGFVSKLAVEHLIKILEANHFATLYSPFFPNQVIAGKNGKLKPFSIKFYSKKIKKRHLILVKGDLQPITVEGQYEVSSKILEFASRKGCKEVITMAGYALNKKIDSPNVYVTSTNKEVFEKFVELGAKQNEAIVPIVGLAGIIPGIASLYKMKGTCLLAETHGAIIDAKGASALLKIFSKYVGEDFDLTKLENRATKIQKMLEEIEKKTQLEEKNQVQLEGNQDVFPKDLSYIR